MDIELKDGTAHDIFALAAILDAALLEALEQPGERKETRRIICSNGTGLNSLIS